ncbi:hypothetical protein [Haloarchaeobius sp. DFWS5]|uniref:hypothetical protein n=1 Tax=Haloarchaeobius sp. DFWS5 TaxID=3446114 RepID=UPI003EBE751C
MRSFDRVRRGLLAVTHGLTGGREETYVCRSCETGYDVQHHVCPECGGYSVDSVEW